MRTGVDCKPQGQGPLAREEGSRGGAAHLREASADMFTVAERAALASQKQLVEQVDVDEAEQLLEHSLQGGREERIKMLRRQR